MRENISREDILLQFAEEFTEKYSKHQENATNTSSSPSS